MKRKVKQTPNIAFYSDEPAVSKSMIADKPPVMGNLANKPPKPVDKSPGRESGLAGFVSKAHLPKKGTGVTRPPLGTAAKQPPKQGALRMSGHSGAHRLGMKLPKLPKV